MVKIIEPKIYRLAATAIDEQGMKDFLSEVGATEFTTDAPSDAEKLVEVAGRLCYMSFQPGLNANVTRTRTGNKSYLKNIIASGHGSVLSHATVTFGLLDVTPVLTHELVRHGVGTAFSQLSGRYVRIEEINFYMPEAFQRAVLAGVIPQSVADALEDEGLRLLQRMEDFQRRMADATDLDNIEAFDIKKQITSAMRRFAPYGIRTHIVFTANHRALRHIVAIRNDVHAEEEIRLVAHAIGANLKAAFPNLYQDMEEQMVNQAWGDEDVWKFSHHKV